MSDTAVYTPNPRNVPFGFEEMDSARQNLRAEENVSRSGFHFVRATEIEPTPPQWLVKGFFEADSLGVVYGPPGSYKSFLALDLACSVASGVPFLGIYPVKGKGPVLYVAGEGMNGLARRRKAWEIERSAQPVEHLYFASMPANLCNSDFMVQVGAAVAEIAETDAPPVLLVIDTWSRNIGGDENGSQDTATAIAALDALRKPHGMTCLIVHHSGWATEGQAVRLRGSTVLLAASDFSYRCIKKEDTGILENQKQKDGRTPEPLAFGLVDVDIPGLVDEDGGAVRSAVLRPTDMPPDSAGGKTPARAQGENQKKALEALNVCFQINRRNLEKGGCDPSGERVSRVQWEMECQKVMDRRRVSEAIEALIKKNLVHLESGGFVVEDPAPIPDNESSFG